MSLSPGTKLATYEILGPIGAGGMGEVYRARDTRLGRDVAVKVLPEELSRDKGRLARFEREARLLASLNHPNIATIHSLEESDHVRFLVMELIDGETLKARIERDPIPWKDACPIFVCIANALEAAHEKGIVHRDLKPANIMITSRGDIKILDFGVAKKSVAEGPLADFSQSPTMPRERTQTGVLLGTAPYMSPEQVRAQTVDKRGDIWAFGCCFYEALCGRHAFFGETLSHTIARILEHEPDWKKIPPDTPETIQRLLRRCLQKDPARRLQAIGDARVELDDALSIDTTPEPSQPSIAVLPFLNLSADPENEYFADGVTEDVIAQLAKIGALKVISRTSVMPFKKREQSLGEIAAKLGVATVLEGSVRRAANRVRIVAQLIDASTDQHLWAETYDRELTDIFAIQSDVALRIASALEVEISPDEKTRIAKKPTTDLVAFELYLKGYHCLRRYTSDGIRMSLEFFEQAIEREPSSALGYLGLAHTYLILGLGYGEGTMGSSDAYSKSKEAAENALELDSDLGEGHAILAFLRCALDFDWIGAEQAYKRAIELSPGSSFAHDGYGILLSALERYDEAIVALKRAQELDPLITVHFSDMATTLLRAERYDEALQAAKRVLDFQPDFPMGRSTLGWAYIKKGMLDQGVAEIEKAVSLVPDNTLLLAQLGQAYAVAGKIDEAHDALQKLEELSRERHVPSYHMAYVYTGLGELDKAMDALEQAYEERAGGVYGIKGSFLFTELRDHPRFKALLKKMNLSDSDERARA